MCVGGGRVFILSTIVKNETFFFWFSFTSLFDSFTKRKEHNFDKLKSVTLKINLLFFQ